MEVRIHWAQKNNNGKYNVKAKTINDAANFMDARGEWGRFSWQLLWQTDATQDLTKVRVNPSYTIQMPSWPGYQNQPDRAKERWDAMWKALYSHEQGHLQIFQSQLDKLIAELEAVNSMNGTELKTRFDATMAAIKDAFDKYDRETEHGKARGVVL